MAGLLDFFKTPEGQGLLAAGFGAAAGARPGQPWNTLGRGGLAGLSGYTGAQDRITQQAESEAQRKYRDMQMTGMQRQIDQQNRQDAWRAGLPAMMQPKPVELDQFTGTTAMQPPDPQALQQYLVHQDSPFADEVMKSLLVKKPAEAFTLGEGQVRYGPDGKIVAQGPAKVDALPSAVREYQFAQGQGYPGTFDQFQKEQKKAGASNVNVSTKVEQKAGESVAAQVGPILEKSLASAEGATRVLDAANRVTKALDTGNVFTGPGANVRVTLAQVANMFGVSGKDEQETLLNTRRVIRGLSEMTLQGRKEMSGQGAITDRESSLAEKATSGDISDLTAGELRELANASARASQYQIQKHQGRVKSAGALPGMAHVTPFFEVPEMAPPPSAANAPAPAASMRWNPQTKKLEPVGR